MKQCIRKCSISNELAKKMVQASEKKAEELGIGVITTIVDESGHLVNLSKMDNAPILSIDISQNKAYTSVSFGKPTHEWYSMIKDEPSLLHGITHTPRLTIFGGGFPIQFHDEIIGGIGVSGGSVEQDMACCEAALEMINE